MFNETEGSALDALILETFADNDAWEKITTDVERCFRIRTIVTDCFKTIQQLCAHPVKLLIQATVGRLEEVEPVFDSEEMNSFLTLAQILSASLLSSLDDGNVHDFATPYRALSLLDKALRGGNNDSRQKSLSSLGVAFSIEHAKLQAALNEMDWQKGWGF